MVWIGGTRRMRRGGVYRYDPYRRRGGGCLRDLFFVEAGCCVAESLGCGPGLVLLAPTLAQVALHGPAGTGRAERMIRFYQEQISARRARPCCRMTPSCSHYALEALQTHGTARGMRLTAARLLRCRPGGPVGADPVPRRAAAWGPRAAAGRQRRRRHGRWLIAGPGKRSTAATAPPGN